MTERPIATAKSTTAGPHGHRRRPRRRPATSRPRCLDETRPPRSRRPAPSGDGRWQYNRRPTSPFRRALNVISPPCRSRSPPAGITRQQAPANAARLRQMNRPAACRRSRRKPLNPGCRVVVGGEAIDLLQGSMPQPSPDLRRPRALAPARVDDPVRPHPSRLFASVCPCRRCRHPVGERPNGSPSADLPARAWTRYSPTAETVGVSEAPQRRRPERR